MSVQQRERKEHKRAPLHFRTRITADGREGLPVEAGRYRLVVSLACPWANRLLIARRLFGLEQAIPVAVTDPVQEMIEGDYHWVFSEANGDPDGRDRVLGIHALREAYLAAEPDYTGGVSVPAVVDTTTGHLVSNDFPNLTLDLGSEWRALHRPGAPDLYPAHLREEIDTVAEEVYQEVNCGVYHAGFAQSQEVYDRAVTKLFRRLDLLEQRLSTRRYLVGDRLTEADVRLWVTLIRFDPVYHGHFKCNIRKLAEYPALWGYTRDLFQTPGFGDTIDFEHIQRHYYATHDMINPTRIVAHGPDPALLLTPHGREALGGSPFGPDATAPDPV
ncbi:glutathione S-transferase family protein [Streptacidiphilus pinicola]|uniref:Glutathione S-transferase family protein n=1 Tax=Streptacidiphilus pinicola TaxID=2219663 RepID=A0A2X0K711_9ACTN|nr:glutathione S-transferase C-terminal domain-containing protein [Streptacidiphilus pinicola]RAG83030.1 glutathione S-transferase family protein [Streptacidiphilus pinicola]